MNGFWSFPGKEAQSSTGAVILSKQKKFASPGPSSDKVVIHITATGAKPGKPCHL
jgi:hypothetical protein